ncbi:FAD-binding oxidoreductase [Companilactobacillus keshanensis]|uniref:FAD-binding oxidoreductase n=1 Tax=Companilactobacillus keshanensis TaxID=2486003 RepID=A0ABW4BR44_9LACO|nr:FAD-binding oxidoreductase [Companilactobacillus keshanensis]
MLKKHRFSLGLFWLVAIFLVPLPFLQTLSNGLPIIYKSEFRAIYYGTIAYVWMLVAIYLSTKPKWLDRLIGLPEMYMVHGILSIAAIILAYLHKEGTSSSGWIKTTGDWAFDLFLGLMIYSMIFMAGWLTNRVTILKKIKIILERIFRHELSIWIHRLNIVATILVFIHVQLISYITAIRPFMIWFDVASLFVLGSYLFSKFIQPLTYDRTDVIQNRKISENIQELTLELPRSSKIKLLAGDYIFLSFPDINGLKEMHPFSIVNVPDKTRRIVLAIRGDGDFTKRLSKIEPGTVALIDGGFGRYEQFLKEQPSDANIVVLAGGIGVTPLISTIEGNLSRSIMLMYSVHNQKDLIYQDKFAQWQKSGLDYVIQVGRFKDKQLQQKLPRNWQNNTVFLIGGPSKMMHHWVRFLKAQGAKSGQIYFEEFSW